MPATPGICPDFEPFVQLAYLYEGKRRTDLRIVENDILGDMPSYNMLDLSAGIRKDNWTLNLYVKNLTDERAQFNRYTGCAETVCGASGVAPQLSQWPDLRSGFHAAHHRIALYAGFLIVLA